MDPAVFEARNKDLEKALNDLRSLIPGIEAAAVVSIEGLPICSLLPQNIDETRVAAMTAAMLSLGERATLELGKGTLVRIMVEGSDGYMLSVAAGDKAVLTISASKTTRIGLIFHDVGKAATTIGELLE
ncbi:MAG: roadblock/LC7 domain-containing protein [Promethearchaeota archaeon]